MNLVVGTPSTKDTRRETENEAEDEHMTTLRTFNNFGRMVPFESTRWHNPPKLIEVMHKGTPILLRA